MAKYEKLSASIGGAVEEAKTAAEELRDELQSWLDNLPESLADGSKADEIQEAIDSLEEAMNELEGVGDNDQTKELYDYNFEYQQIVYPKSTYMSREKRLVVACCALQGVPDEIPNEVKASDDEKTLAMEQMLESISNARDALGNVSFPTR